MFCHSLAKVFVIALLTTATAHADTIIYVCDTCNYTEIEEAVSEAGNGDTVMVSAGTYNEQNIDTKRSITIVGEVDKITGVPITIVNGSSRSIFKVDNKNFVTFRNLVIQNGKSDEGGGVQIDSSSHADFENCIIRNNEGSKGAGVYVNSSSANFYSCVFDSNECDDEGGAIFLNSTRRTINLTDCTITNNSAKKGAGIYANSADEGDGVVIENCHILSNDAEDEGGGIRANSSPIEMSCTTVCDNSPNQVQGGYNDNGDNCVNSSCNNCDNDGDGVFNCQDICPGQDDTIDSDGDDVPNCQDGCPDNPDKTEPGDCGCDAADVDSDDDGALDCQDNCPDDPDKTDPGECGCNEADVDTDKDGTLDCNDACQGFDDDLDVDQDGIPNGCDCIADLNNDGTVDSADLGLLLALWGESDINGDINRDGTIDGEDLAYVLGHWGSCIAP